jgi:hypothetical protein
MFPSVCIHELSGVVEDVAPAVAGVDDMVARLNASNDFAAFVKSMRTKFKALCN